MALYRQYVFCVFLQLSVLPTAAETLTIRHFPFEGEKEKYMEGLVELALSYSDLDVQFEVNSRANYTDLDRSQMVNAIEQGEISIMWSGTSKQLEKQLRPIRIPLYKGLLGMRLLLISPDQQQKFDSVHSIDALKNIRLGQGKGWPDVTILENAGFNVVLSPTYEALFGKLNAGEFDAFPRGLQEPWAEIKSNPDIPLTVESNLLLAYKLPTYFFVSNQNTQLAHALENGLKKAIADKNFDDYFFYSDQVMDALKNANAVGRIILSIDNPYLPPDTPVDEKALWLDIGDL